MGAVKSTMTEIDDEKIADELDEVADRLGDAVDAYRERREKLLGELTDVLVTYEDAITDAGTWAMEVGLIDSLSWMDEDGDTFLPLAPVDAETAARTEVPDMITLFRERVANLSSSGTQEGEAS